MAVFTEPTKWAQTLGKDADVVSIPNTAGDTDPSIDKIFPSVFSIPLAQGGRAIPRSVLNGLFKLVGDWSFYQQNGGIASYSADFDYAVGSVVKYNNQIFLCIKENGASSTVANPSNGVYWTSFSGIPSQTSQQIQVVHNNIFRGDNLLNHFASIDAIQTVVQNGDFSNIYVGDFIPATITYAGTQYTTNYRVAGINTFWRYGDTPLEVNHLVIIPDQLFSAPMNDTDTTAGGYVGSKMYTTTLPALLNSLAGNSSTPFYGKIISHREYFMGTNIVWVDDSLCLLNEVELYGFFAFAEQEQHRSFPSQLPLFRINPYFMNQYNRSSVWLRDFYNDKAFAFLHYQIRTNLNSASTSYQVRPRFLFG